MQFESCWAGHQAVRLPAPCPPPATGRFSLCQGAPRSIGPVLPPAGRANASAVVKHRPLPRSAPTPSRPLPPRRPHPPAERTALWACPSPPLPPLPITAPPPVASSPPLPSSPRRCHELCPPLLASQGIGPGLDGGATGSPAYFSPTAYGQAPPQIQSICERLNALNSTAPSAISPGETSPPQPPRASLASPTYVYLHNTRHHSLKVS